MEEARTDKTDMPRQRDRDTGQYEATYPLDRFEDALRALDGGASTQEVADHVGCVYTTAYTKLRELENEGRATSRKIANARLWMVPDQ